MPWMDQIGGLLKQYTGGAATAAAPAPDVHAHFDQVAGAAPQSAIAEGLAAAFHSDQTPAFGTMLSGLFANSTGEQKAGLLNSLLANVNPAMLSSIAGGGTSSSVRFLPPLGSSIIIICVRSMAASSAIVFDSMTSTKRS